MEQITSSIQRVHGMQEAHVISGTTCEFIYGHQFVTKSVHLSDRQCHLTQKSHVDGSDSSRTTMCNVTSEDYGRASNEMYSQYFRITAEHRLAAGRNKMHVWMANVHSRIYGDMRNHYALQALTQLIRVKFTSSTEWWDRQTTCLLKWFAWCFPLTTSERNLIH